MFGILIAILFGVIAFICFYFELRKWRINRKQIKNYQSLKEYPIIGIAGRFIGQNNEEVMRTTQNMFYETKKKPFRAWFGPVLLIGIDEPEDMQIILNADQCLDKPYMYKHLRNENGLLGSNKEIWKQHRRALNPTFNIKVLLGFIPIFNKKAKTLADQMEQNVGKSIDIYRPVFKCLTDTILSTALGMNWQLQSSKGDEVHDIFINTMDHFQRRITRVWLKWDFIYSFTKACKEENALLQRGYQFLRSIREVKEIELAEKLVNGEDVLENGKQENNLTWIQKCFLMHREGKFTEQDLIEEIDTAFVGGTDTTTVALTGAIIMLAIHQECQEKVVAELREVCDSADSPITYDDLAKMTYTEMVIKEALRHFPVGPITGRECSDDFEFKNGTIPKGSIILMNVFKLHKDERFWGPKANSFYPEHFLPENFEKMHPYSYLAFSGGQRNCIGIKYAWCSAKIILAYLLRRYKFTSDLKYEDIRTKVNVILKIANEDPVQVERRVF